MIIVTNNWRIWAVGMAASLLISAAVYFAVIQPAQSTANQALRTGLQQTQQVINAAQKQISTVPGRRLAAVRVGKAGSDARQVQQQVGSAAKLAACVTAAGTDTGKIQACEASAGN
jgi:hypothetical protein